MKQSIKGDFDVTPSLGGTIRTASANGTGVDLQGFQAAVFLVQPVSWVDGTHALKAQESDDNSSFTDVAAADLDGTFPSITAGGTTVTRVGYLGAKRYVRAVTTVSGTTTGATYAVAVLRGHARKGPK